MTLLIEKIRFKRLDAVKSRGENSDSSSNTPPEEGTNDRADRDYPQLFGTKNAPTDNLDPDDDNEVAGIVDDATEDPDRQGLIRTVEGAHLIFKRKTADGTFEELWMYKTKDLREGTTRRRAILAGTDIPVNKRESEDSVQSYSIWTVGNVEMMKIVGLPN